MHYNNNRNGTVHSRRITLGITGTAFWLQLCEKSVWVCVSFIKKIIGFCFCMYTFFWVCCGFVWGCILSDTLNYIDFECTRVTHTHTGFVVCRWPLRLTYILMGAVVR